MAVKKPLPSYLAEYRVTRSLQTGVAFRSEVGSDEIVISEWSWENLGKPEVVTVTITPGAKTEGAVE